MKHALLAGSLALAATIGLGSGANAQMSQPDDSFSRQQVEHKPRDITDQDIVDKAELDAVSDRRSSKRGSKKNGPVPATQEDIVAGSQIRDNKGETIGTVDRLDADGVVVATSVGRFKVPLDAFGKDSNGLMFAISKAEFDQMVTGTPGG